MRTGTFLVCVAALAAAGCKRQPSVELTNASIDDVMKQQAAAVKMRPGEWEVAVETLGTTATGAPAGIPSMPQPTKLTSRTCLTPEQVERPTAMFGGGMMQPFKDSCRYDRFEMKGGRLDATMHCAMPGGPTVVATTRGTFTATDLATESESKVGGMPNGMAVTSKVKMTGHRVGECRAANG